VNADAVRAASLALDDAAVDGYPPLWQRGHFEWARIAVAAAEPVIRAQVAAEVRRRCIDKGHAIHFETRATALCADCSDLADGIAGGVTS